jgi:hypothetical protein
MTVNALPSSSIPAPRSSEPDQLGDLGRDRRVPFFGRLGPVADLDVQVPAVLPVPQKASMTAGSARFAVIWIFVARPGR